MFFKMFFKIVNVFRNYRLKLRWHFNSHAKRKCHRMLLNTEQITTDNFELCSYRQVYFILFPQPTWFSKSTTQNTTVVVVQFLTVSISYVSQKLMYLLVHSLLDFSRPPLPCIIYHKTLVYMHVCLDFAHSFLADRQCHGSRPSTEES